MLALTILVDKSGWMWRAKNQPQSRDACHPFGDKWEGRRDIAVDTLRYVTELLDYYKIPYFLAYGTLLGHEREGALIDWDNDLDIVVIAEPEEVRGRLKRHLKVVTHWRGFDKVFLDDATPVPGQTWKWPFIDIFYASERDGRLTVYNRYGDTVASSYPLDWVEPLRRGEFYGFPVSLPRDSNTILTQEYGSNYRKVCQSSNFDHAREQRVGKTYKVKCRRLKREFDGFPTYVINLEERPDRKANALAQLGKLEILDPVVVRASTPRDEEVRSRYERLPANRVSVEEFACGLSHIGIWQRMVRESTPLALIVEDDICVPDSVTYPDLVARLADSQGAHMTMLGYCGGRASVVESSETGATAFPGRAVCLHAYFLTLAGARRLVKMAEKWDGTVPIDWVTERMCRNRLCFLSTSVAQPGGGSFGHGIIFQNREMGTNIGNKRQFNSYIRSVPSARSLK